jgi:hypothetical protein
VKDVASIAETLPDADSTAAHDLVTSHWIKESFDDAQSKVYISPIEEGNGPFPLTDGYRDAATPGGQGPDCPCGSEIGQRSQ